MNVQRSAGILLALTVMAAGSAVAQGPATRLVADSAGKFQIAFCNLKMGGKVGDGLKAFKTGLEDKDPAKRAAALDQAVKILTTEVGAGGQAASGGAWYYLGRSYLAQGDVAGADSALTKAEKLQPDCEIDIGSYRQNAWAILANAGIEKLRGGDTDSALVLFRQANTLFQKLPHVYENVGVIFANGGQNDSAAFYFGKAAAIAEADTTLRDNRNSATLNYAMTLQRLEKHPEAIIALTKYLSWNPNDTDARKSLSWSYRQSGQVPKADSIDAAMVNDFATMNYDSLSAGDLMSVGVSMFNAQKFKEAADVFEKLRAKNPWSRDAVYNLANAYLALKDWPKLVEVGKQLTLIEPLNEDAYRLTGQAYRELKQQDSLLKEAEHLVGLPISVDVNTFAMGTTASRIEATATGRKATDANGKDIKPTPVAMTWEFLDATGKVLGSQDVNVPALEPGATHAIKAEAKAPGIVAWRYKRK
jgi:tetratricopeptide (TPR) repeat protein